MFPTSRSDAEYVSLRFFLSLTSWFSLPGFESIDQYGGLVTTQSIFRSASSGICETSPHRP
jgi:hypothetical protein